MKGICFKGNLFNKVVSQEKTQTRRMIVSRTGYFQVESRNGVIFDIWQTDANEWCGDNLVPVKPRYEVGEIVYLKEPYYKDSNDDIHYKFGYPENQQEMDKHGLKWSNKLFMSESAARYFIQITDLRVEKLQDISDVDCLKEGIEYAPICTLSWKDELTPAWANGINRYKTPKDAYAALIDKINGKGTWERNPFVWVYDFKLIDKK